MEEKERKIAQEIFEKGNSTFLRGAEAAAFYKKVKEVPKQPNEQLVTQLIKKYEENLHSMLKTAEELKKQISKAMSAEPIKLPEGVNCLGSVKIPLKQEQI